MRQRFMERIKNERQKRPPSRPVSKAKVPGADTEPSIENKAEGSE
jgi:hypothetical protein